MSPAGLRQNVWGQFTNGIELDGCGPQPRCRRYRLLNRFI
jgi:hypothetical protein